MADERPMEQAGYEMARPVASASAPAPKGDDSVKSVVIHRDDGGRWSVMCVRGSDSDAGVTPQTFGAIEEALDYAKGELTGQAKPDADAPPAAADRYASAEGAPKGSSTPYIG